MGRVQLVSLEYYIDVNVFIAIVVEFPLDQYGTELEGISKAFAKQLPNYIGNTVSVQLSYHEASLVIVGLPSIPSAGQHPDGF